MSEQYDQYLVNHIEGNKTAFLWLKEHFGSEFFLGLENDIYQGVLNHDASKYDEEEYLAYDEFFYGSGEKEYLNFKYAWLRHIHHNPHHWQYWVLVNDDAEKSALPMPINYIFEMVCDWWSFSFRDGNLYEIFDWYEERRDVINLHEDTRFILENHILKSIKEELDGGKNERSI